MLNPRSTPLVALVSTSWVYWLPALVPSRRNWARSLPIASPDPVTVDEVTVTDPLPELLIASPGSVLPLPVNVEVVTVTVPPPGLAVCPCS